MAGKDAENFDPQETISKSIEVSFEDWLEIGYSNGWIGAPICYSHDGLPTTEEEDNQWVDGEDPCIHIIRLYEDADVKRGVEANHSPSQWRASNRGLK